MKWYHLESLRTFLVGIKYVSICVSQGKLIGDWRRLSFPFII